MTHFNDDTNYLIKVEPISPPDASSFSETSSEICQSQDLSTLTPLFQSSLSSGNPLWQQMSTIAAAEDGNVRKALKHKIQSDRRSRGEAELVVKFEAGAKRELTAMEVTKREKRKEQNRRAAKKCRLKKRKEQQMAEQESTSVQAENDDLKHCVASLRRECKYLKCILNEHVNSGQCKLGDNIAQRCSPSPQRVPVHLQAHIITTATSTPVVPVCSSQLSQLHPAHSDKTMNLESQSDIIDQIAKALEMETTPSPSTSSDSIRPLTSTTTEEDMDLINTFIKEQGMGDYQDLSQGLGDFLPEFAAHHQPQTNSTATTTTSKPRGVRNLNTEFAQCDNQNALSSTGTHQQFAASEFLTPTESFQNRSEQTTMMRRTTTMTTSNATSQLGQASILQGSHNTTATVGGDRLPAISAAAAPFLPESPESACTSPPSVTSPSFLYSPAELHPYSPGATTSTGCIFQY